MSIKYNKHCASIAGETSNHQAICTDTINRCQVPQSGAHPNRSVIGQ